MTRDPLGTFQSRSPDDTARLGRRLAADLACGDTLCLEGPLGAGKSHLARAIVHALTGETEIPSPTYTLVQTYAAQRAEVWHADLYRLSDPHEADELGLVDAMAEAIVLIEWPDRLETAPDGALWISLAAGADADHRTITLTGPAVTWRRAVARALGGQTTDA